MNNLELIPGLPVYDEDLKRIKEKRKKDGTLSAFQEVLIDIMNERRLRDSDVVRDTGIPFSTFHGWITQEAKCPLVDENLKKLMRYFNVHLEFLVFGIGSGEPAFNESEEDQIA